MERLLSPFIKPSPEAFYGRVTFTHYTHNREENHSIRAYVHHIIHACLFLSLGGVDIQREGERGEGGLNECRASILTHRATARRARAGGWVWE